MPSKPGQSWFSAAFAALFIAGFLAGFLQAQKSTPRPPDRIALGEGEVRQLLLLMDTNKNGKVSREEFMAFMAAEFDRLDKDKSGELDPAELAASRVRASRPFTGK